MAPLLNGVQHEPQLVHGLAAKGSDDWLLNRFTGQVFREYECASGTEHLEPSPAPLWSSRTGRPTAAHNPSRARDRSMVPCRRLKSTMRGADAHPLALGPARLYAHLSVA
jgi:hypothetical protein